jgi:hypothetical protein
MAKLYGDQGGRIVCAKHAPRRTSDFWKLDGWYRLSAAEIAAWLAFLRGEGESGSPCEYCRAAER